VFDGLPDGYVVGFILGTGVAGAEGRTKLFVTESWSELPPPRPLIINISASSKSM